MSLAERLRDRIQREGPISFYEWMKAALYDERDGYYCADRLRQGRAGDYRTAPETSPLFSSTFAGYFAKLFRELGSPSRFTIVEVGAGSGEFANGVLTTLQVEHPDVFAATNYVIQEVSEASRHQCAARLSEFSGTVVFSRADQQSGVELAGRPHDGLTGVIFSNELIDAFPVNRVVMRDGRLRQLYVGLNEVAFVWIEGAVEPAVGAYCERVNLNLRDGQIAEINLDAETFITRAASLLQRGFVVTVDYGAERSELLSSADRFGGTLRAFQHHQFADDLLARPGERDLTSTVDWTQLKAAGDNGGLCTIRLEPLDQFLIAEGILERIAGLAKSVTDMAETARLTASARELILPTGMASSFQVLVQEKAHR